MRLEIRMELRGLKGQMRGRNCKVLIKNSRRPLTSCGLFRPRSLETSGENNTSAVFTTTTHKSSDGDERKMSRIPKLVWLVEAAQA